MAWADLTIEKLQLGETVQCRPRGHSMSPKIRDRQLVTLSPETQPKLGDAVLCRVHGTQYLHLIKAMRGAGDQQRFLIGNNRGRDNGWIPRTAIYGVAITVE